MTIERLNKDYKSEEGQPIPFRKLGFHSLDAFLASIPDTVKVCGNGPCAIVRFVPSEKSEHIRQMISEQKKPSNAKRKAKTKMPQQNNYGMPRNTSNAYMPQKPFTQQPHRNRRSRSRSRSRNRLANLNSNGPRIISNLPAYTNEIRNTRNLPPAEICEKINGDKEVDQVESAFKTSLTLDDNKETTPKTPSKQLDQVKSTRRHFIEALLALAESKKTATSSTEESNANEEIITKHDMSNEAIPACALTDLVYRVDFPEYAVMFGEKIPTSCMPANIKRNDTISIFVSEVHSPYKFWFHIHEVDHCLDILMNDIEHFYAPLEVNQYCMPEASIVPGQICAALFNSMWHRAEVLTAVMNGKAKVLYVDYGTVAEVDVRQIKYLAKKFLRLPRQALRGSLSHIKPRNSHWTSQATQSFLSNVYDVPVFGKISEIDEATRVYHFVLCNSINEKIVQINTLLIEQGFALYDEEWQEERIQHNESRLRRQHPRETLPTFELLESGQYPTLAEILRLLEMGIDYESIIDAQLFHPGNLSDIEHGPEFLRHVPFKLLTTNPFCLHILLQAKHALNVR